MAKQEQRSTGPSKYSRQCSHNISDNCRKDIILSGDQSLQSFLSTLFRQAGLRLVL